MSEKIPFVLSSKTLSMIIDGKSEIIDRTALNYAAIVDALKKGDSAKVRELVTVRNMLTKLSDGKVEVDQETKKVTYNGEEIHNAVVDRMFEMLSEGFDISPMVNFLTNLLQNESKTSIEELYLFLEASNLPITEDGHFLAYKMVTGEYLDIYSGTYDNHVGNKLQMRRLDVDDNRYNTCSHGFHFCSESYLASGFGSADSGHRIVIVKINPKDVVSIPADYNNAKGRTCEYVVVDELDDWQNRLKAYFVANKKPTHSEASNDGIPEWLEEDEDEEEWDEFDDDDSDLYSVDVTVTESTPTVLVGEDNPAAVLTEAKVRQIRMMAADKWSQTAIAEVIGVSRRTVGRVLSGETWTHVK